MIEQNIPELNIMHCGNHCSIYCSGNWLRLGVGLAESLVLTISITFSSKNFEQVWIHICAAHLRFEQILPHVSYTNLGLVWNIIIIVNIGTGKGADSYSKFNF